MSQNIGKIKQITVAYKFTDVALFSTVGEDATIQARETLLSILSQGLRQTKCTGKTYQSTYRLVELI